MPLASVASSLVRMCPSQCSRRGSGSDTKRISRWVLLPGISTRMVSGCSIDVRYSNMLYLTSIEQPDTILVLMPGNKTQREILFVSEPDPRREHWEGHILTKEEATEASGIATVFYTRQFEAFLTSMFGRRVFG